MRPREFKDEVFRQFARVASAFASPKRIELIDVLAQGERNVETLASETGLSLANASRHLQVLKNCGLVSYRKRGLRVYYRLSDRQVLAGYRALRLLAEDRLAEVRRLAQEYFRGAGGVEGLDRRTLLRRSRAGTVLIVDVRPSEEFEAGHIAGALSIPLADLERRLAELPAGQQIVAYCRGPYCVLAEEAVRFLERKGRQAIRLQEGYPEWRDAGLPVETASTRR